MARNKRKQRSIKKQLKQIVALVLVLTMVMPYIVIAEDSEYTSSAWLNMPEILPIETSSAYDDFPNEDYASIRLATLLSRQDEFDAFTAEEQLIVLAYLGA